MGARKIFSRFYLVWGAKKIVFFMFVFVCARKIKNLVMRWRKNCKLQTTSKEFIVCALQFLLDVNSSLSFKLKTLIHMNVYKIKLCVREQKMYYIFFYIFSEKRKLLERKEWEQDKIYSALCIHAYLTHKRDDWDCVSRSVDIYNNFFFLSSLLVCIGWESWWWWWWWREMRESEKDIERMGASTNLH